MFVRSFVREVREAEWKQDTWFRREMQHVYNHYVFDTIKYAN